MISFGMSIYDSVKVDTMVALFAAIAELSRRGEKVQMNILKGFYVHNYREQLVERALASGATHLMFIDSDMTFLPDAVPTLLSRHQDIVGAPYVWKTPPHENIVKLIRGGELVSAGYDVGRQPFPCYSVGTGFMLVKMTVFSKVDPPWFRIEQEGQKMIGEDVSFCRRAAEAGCSVWCDPTIPIGHIGEQTYFMP